MQIARPPEPPRAETVYYAVRPGAEWTATVTLSLRDAMLLALLAEGQAAKRNWTPRYRSLVARLWRAADRVVLQ